MSPASANSGQPRPNGTLTKSSSTKAPPAAASRPCTKLKVTVRRLPPCLTEEEFTARLGEEWKVGNGKIDWFDYRPGKRSKDVSKPSVPSRAYLHATAEEHIIPLSEAVATITFEDAELTYTDPCLVGLPLVEFSAYGRIPSSSRNRVDLRAGTIDQDPEFMAFLQEQTNAPVKEPVADVGASTKPEEITTTPLVQYLKDKKAGRSKDAASKAARKLAGNGKDSSSATPNPSASGSSTEDSKKKSKDGRQEKVEAATKEVIKVLNRSKLSSISAGEASKTDTTKTRAQRNAAASAANMAPAARIRMLQRDLGLTPAQAHRQVKRDNADALKAERAAAGTSPDSSQNSSSTAPTAPKLSIAQANRRARGRAPELETNKASTGSASTPTTASPNPQTPVILLKKPEISKVVATPSPVTTQTVKPTLGLLRKPQQQVMVPAEGATQAFIKHANASQGVTEQLLKEALEKFGAVTNLEIDKRKGFAYVDFVDGDGLKKAMAANPVPVAQGTVVVLQRKGVASPLSPEKKPQQTQAHPSPFRGGRGSGRGGGGMGRGSRGGRGGLRGAFQGGENSKPPAGAPTAPAGK